MEKNEKLNLNGDANMNIKKLYDIQIMFNGDEKNINKIVMQLMDITKHKDVASFSIQER